MTKLQQKVAQHSHHQGQCHPWTDKLDFPYDQAWSSCRSDISQVKSSHKKADTRLILHVREAKEVTQMSLFLLSVTVNTYHLKYGWVVELQRSQSTFLFMQLTSHLWLWIMLLYTIRYQAVTQQVSFHEKQSEVLGKSMWKTQPYLHTFENPLGCQKKLGHL